MPNPLFRVGGMPPRNISPVSMRPDRAMPERTAAPLGSFDQGGEVPETGIYKLHKGEHVLTTDQKAAMHKAFSRAEGEAPKKPAKKVKHMIHRRSKNGGFITVHKHHAPHDSDQHDEEFTHAHLKDLQKHMADHAESMETPAQEGMESPGVEQAEKMIGLEK